MQKAEGRRENAQSGGTHHAPFFILHSSFFILEKLPFLLLSLISCLQTVRAQQGAIQPLANIPFAARLSNALIAYARYLGKTLWPVDLATPYPYPSHWPLASALLAAALVAGLTVAAVGLRSRSPFVATGWLWFLGMLVPVIGLVQVGEQSMADRYTYLPSIGLFIMLVWGLANGLNRLNKLDELNKLNEAAVASRGLRSSNPFGPFNPINLFNSVAFVFAALVLLACAARTRDQLQYWRDSESLFRHAVTVSKKNFFAYYNLGSVLDNQGRTDEALTNYLKAVELQPHYPEPLNNIGCILAGRKQFAQAIPYFEAALRSTPEFPNAHNNLAHALCELGRFEEAIPHFQTVLKANPQDTVALNSLAGAHFSLGKALATQGNPHEAMGHFREALRLQPDFTQARHALQALALPSQ